MPAARWDVDAEAGDPVTLFSRSYVFERVDVDGTVTFRSPAGSDEGDFMVIDDTGRRRKPTVEEVLALTDEDLIWHEKALGSEARRFARAQQLDADQARARDPKCQFVMAICRRFDADPWSRSDASLRAFMTDALADPVIAALPGAWAASPATVRTWLNERGTEGCRKERDGISMKNRMPTIRKLNHPLEIVFYHAAAANNVRGSVVMNYNSYVAEIVAINAGLPLKRNTFNFETCKMSEARAEYPVPATPYVEISYLRFWRLCHELRGEKAYARKTSKQAAYQRYGGGGFGNLPTHLGAMCWIDSSPVKKAFFVDDATGIPIGQSTFTVMLEGLSKAVLGWDLCAGACNSSSILRTVLKANQVKIDIPEYLLKIDPNLPYLRLRPDVIGFDNSSEAHGRTVEQILGDAYIGTKFVGAEMPRDKNAMERIISTFEELLYNHVEDANYDIARMRLYGFDPDSQVLCSIATGRRLFALAAMTYNVLGNRGLDKRQPALVWKQRLGSKKLKVIKNIDEFRDNIGVVGKATINNAGFEKFNRRYTAGALEMRRIVQDFERAARTPSGDIAPTPKRARNRDDRKRPTFEVRIRWDEDDIGVIKVWNPHASPKARWERFGCTDPNAHGMPHWLHQRCLELAQREAMDYLSPQGQSVVRARLFEDIANTDSQAAERKRQTLGLALADPRIKQVMSAYVEVTDEVISKTTAPAPEEHEPVGHALSTGKRPDDDIDTPRSAPVQPKPPVALRKRKGSSGKRAEQGDDRSVQHKIAGPNQGSSLSSPQTGPSTSKPERRRTNSTNDDRRTTAHPKSADRPDQRAPKRARSNRLKYGDQF